MFRCCVYVKIGKKGLAFCEVVDNREDSIEYNEFGELGLVVETTDREAMARLVRGYKNFRRRQLQKKG